LFVQISILLSILVLIQLFKQGTVCAPKCLQYRLHYEREETEYGKDNGNAVEEMKLPVQL